jgi:hypothetical protein
LTPARTPISAAGDKQHWRNDRRNDGGEMSIKAFALTAVVGLLVTGSAAFVANHPHPVMACASACD